MRASEATEEELLNRIAAIRAAAAILDDHHELSNGDRHAFLTVIQTETARLHALVRHIASLSPDCLGSDPPPLREDDAKLSIRPSCGSSAGIITVGGRLWCHS